MTWIDLGEPRPRTRFRQYSPLVWPVSAPQLLPSGVDFESPSFLDVVRRRQTDYGFEAPTIEDIGRLLELTARARSVGNDGLGFPLMKTAAPSAGAIHPIHVLLHRAGTPEWQRYCPVEHALMDVPGAPSPSDVRDALDKVVDGGHGVLILFAAEPGKTFAKYESACSLVWRDAGVLLGYFSLAAQALSLRFVPLGVTADDWVRGLAEDRRLVGVGAAYFGRPLG